MEVDETFAMDAFQVVLYADSKTFELMGKELMSLNCMLFENII